MEYLDFELEIGPGRGREFPVRVLRSPAGEARGTMRFPYDDLALDNRLQAIEIELLRANDARRGLPSARESAAETFGTELFECLVAGAVRSRWEVSRRESARQDLGLRLKLRVDSPELAALPWEFLHDPDAGEYLSLSRATPVVRYLELPHPVEPLRVTTPLRILAMASAPSDLAALDVRRERHRIAEAVSRLEDDGTVEVHWVDGQDWRSLQRALRGGPWHVFHFVGHGGFDPENDEGVIALVGRDGSSRRVTATQLGRLLADHRSLRLALLNSCEGGRSGGRDIFSSTSSVLVRRGVPAVLAMQYQITDRASIEFARGFYEAVADGLAIDDAVTEARKGLSLAIDGTIEWATPVLFMHAPDGVLFDLSAPDPASATGAGTRASGASPDADPGQAASPETGVRIGHGRAEVTGGPDDSGTQDGPRVGIRVIDGVVHPDTRARILRDEATLVDGELVELTRRVGDQDLELPMSSEGNECSVVVAGYDRPRPGDVVETYEWLADGSDRTADGFSAAIRHGGHVIRFKSYPSPEEVFHDDRLVSSHSAWALRSQPHEFDVEEEGETVHYEIRTGMRWSLKWWWEVRRNGRLVHADR